MGPIPLMTVLSVQLDGLGSSFITSRRTPPSRLILHVPYVDNIILIVAIVVGIASFKVDGARRHGAGEGVRNTGIDGAKKGPCLDIDDEEFEGLVRGSLEFFVIDRTR